MKKFCNVITNVEYILQRYSINHKQKSSSDGNSVFIDVERILFVDLLIV